jgi:hypothetical protein
LALSRFPSITQLVLAKASNDLVDFFASQGNLPQLEGLLVPLRQNKHLNTPTSSLKCGDTNGSTSTNNKSKYNNFVASEVNESILNQVKLHHKIYNQQISNPSFMFFFPRSILQVEFNHVYSFCNI